MGPGTSGGRGARRPGAGAGQVPGKAVRQHQIRFRASGSDRDHRGEERRLHERRQARRWCPTSHWRRGTAARVGGGERADQMVSAAHAITGMRAPIGGRPRPAASLEIHAAATEGGEHPPQSVPDPVLAVDGSGPRPAPARATDCDARRSCSACASMLVHQRRAFGVVRAQYSPHQGVDDEAPTAKSTWIPRPAIKR